jgi:hypothetical protein
MYPHSTVPEYTVSLLIWIAPVAFLACFFIVKRLLTPEKSFALFITVTGLAAIGCLLDLVFGKMFFLFPNPCMVLHLWRIRGMPAEEFVFYITGFWFIIFLYVFGDEWFLKKYNRPDERYARYRDRLTRTIFPHWTSLKIVIGFLVLGIVLKRILNPAGGWIPGYFFFLACTAYTPMILFYRVSKRFVNWQAFWFTLIVTMLISVIWEATLALPRGYWDYHHAPMLGIFIGPWHDLPIEAVTVWIFCTLVIIVYEYVKIVYFTRVPSIPCHGMLLKIGKEWKR